MTDICLYAICGDNERDEDLDRWFECALEADYALVFFTGTNAHIRSRLSGFENKCDHFVLFDHPRSGDRLIDPFRFDKARNESIVMAEETFPEADVFFTIDMDEYMEPGWTKIIKDGWIPGKHQRISYSHRHFEAEIASGRNWGHARGWRWKYPCHEVMIRGYNGDIWYDNDECLNLDGKLEVVHYRDPSKPRSSYLGLLELRWEENQDPATLAYLVREYMYNAQYDKIMELHRDVDRVCNKEGSEACMAYVCLGDAYEQTGDIGTAEYCYKNSIELGNGFRRGYSVYGRFLIDRKRYGEALDVLELGLKRTTYTTHTIFVDPADLWTWHYWDWLCVAAYWCDKPAMALQYALNAYSAAPDNDHVKWNLRESYALLERNL